MYQSLSLSETKWGSWYPRGPPLCLQPINKTKKASNKSAVVNGHNITSHHISLLLDCLIYNPVGQLFWTMELGTLLTRTPSNSPLNKKQTNRGLVLDKKKKKESLALFNINITYLCIVLFSASVVSLWTWTVICTTVQRDIRCGLHLNPSMQYL